MVTGLLQTQGWWSLNISLCEDINAHSHWKRTWGLVMEISYAIINVNKTSGTSKSNYKVIDAHYRDNKDIISGQIDAISPNIIINCSGVHKLFNDIKKGEKQPIGPFYVAESVYGIIINAYHPNQRILKKEKYFEYIRECLNVKF